MLQVLCRLPGLQPLIYGYHVPRRASRALVRLASGQFRRQAAGCACLPSASRAPSPPSPANAIATTEGLFFN